MNIVNSLRKFPIRSRPLWWNVAFFVVLVVAIRLSGFTLAADIADWGAWVLLFMGIVVPLYALEYLLWWAFTSVGADNGSPR